MARAFTRFGIAHASYPQVGPLWSALLFDPLYRDRLDERTGATMTPVHPTLVFDQALLDIDERLTVAEHDRLARQLCRARPRTGLRNRAGHLLIALGQILVDPAYDTEVA